MNLLRLFILSLFLCPFILNAGNVYYYGGIARGDVSKKKLSLVFTGGWHSEGADYILKVLREKNVKGGMFVTGNYLRNSANYNNIVTMINEGHYLGAHSNNHPHLVKSFSGPTLISKSAYFADLDKNFVELAKFGIAKDNAEYFIPPSETYNTTIAKWTEEYGLILFKHTDGTRTNGDYTDPSMRGYLSSQRILSHIWSTERNDPNGLNGHMMLIHLGVGPKRTDKFYYHMPKLIDDLRAKGYELVRVDELLGGPRQEKPTANLAIKHVPTSVSKKTPSELVRKVQQKLTDLGFDPKGVDGLEGNNTRSALNAFYTSIGKKFDGTISDNELADLNAAAE